MEILSGEYAALRLRDYSMNQIACIYLDWPRTSNYTVKSNLHSGFISTPGEAPSSELITDICVSVTKNEHEILESRDRT